MKLGIMQPYFFAYLGYWQLINHVDEYIIYDDVTYIKGGWINRNNFLVNGNKKLISIQLEKASSYSLIKDIYIKDDFTVFLKTIEYNYKKAPYFNDVYKLIEEIFEYQDKHLGMFLFNLHSKVCDYVGIRTKLILSSKINKNNELKGKDKVIHICKLLDASEYINAIGGTELYDKQEFSNNGITLSFLQSNLPEYKQFKNPFIPGLSIIDILMFNSIQDVQKMLKDFILV